MLSKSEKLQRIQELKQKIALQSKLPHIYDFKKLYKWQEDFIYSYKNYDINSGKTAYNLLVAANQIGKSTCQHIKWVRYSTDQKIRNLLWPKKKPRLFYYLYPDKKTVRREYLTKIKPTIMPRDEFIDHPVYGYKEDWEGKWLSAIHWNSGTSTFFLTYESSAHGMQSSTPNVIFTDEELPYSELFPELNMRLSNPTLGYTEFNCVFTATRGQVEWREVLEGKRLKEAWKRNVSMYDCLEYSDGTPSMWTKEKIEAIASTLTPKEYERRVLGRFVKSEGLKFPNFERNRNYKPKMQIPSSWFYSAGVDWGGGGKSHPSAVVICAISPDLKLARVVRSWKGKGEITTCQDTILKYLDLCKTLNLPQTHHTYFDWAAKDLGTIASRMGLTFLPAEKGKDHSERLVNALLKTGQLIVEVNEDTDNEELCREFESIPDDGKKNKLKDDLADALKYSLSKIPFVFDVKIMPEKQVVIPPKKIGREIFYEDDLEVINEIEGDIDEWNEHYGF